MRPSDKSISFGCRSFNSARSSLLVAVFRIGGPGCLGQSPHTGVSRRVCHPLLRPGRWEPNGRLFSNHATVAEGSRLRSCWLRNSDPPALAQASPPSSQTAPLTWEHPASWQVSRLWSWAPCPHHYPLRILMPRRPPPGPQPSRASGDSLWETRCRWSRPACARSSRVSPRCAWRANWPGCRQLPGACALPLADGSIAIVSHAACGGGRPCRPCRARRGIRNAGSPRAAARGWFAGSRAVQRSRSVRQVRRYGYHPASHRSSDTAACRVCQNDDVGQARFPEPLHRDRRPRHLHEREDSLLHASAARSGKEDKRWLALNGTQHARDHRLTGGHAERSGHEAKVLDRRDAFLSVESTLADQNSILERGRRLGVF